MPRRAPSALAALALCLAGAGCSAARPLRPLPAGAYAGELSVPGVWLSDRRTFPVGAPALGLRRGLPADLEVAVRWYPALLPARIVGLESGVTWHARPAHGWVPALHLGGALSAMVAPAHLDGGPSRALRGACTADATAHWEPLPWLWPYVVAQGAVILEDGQPLASAFAGARLRLSRRWAASLETGIAGMNVRSRDYTLPYQGIDGRGAIWLSWSVEYAFGAGPGASGTPAAAGRGAE